MPGTPLTGLEGVFGLAHPTLLRIVKRLPHQGVSFMGRGAAIGGVQVDKFQNINRRGTTHSSTLTICVNLTLSGVQASTTPGSTRGRKDLRRQAVVCGNTPARTKSTRTGVRERSTRRSSKDITTLLVVTRTSRDLLEITSRTTSVRGERIRCLRLLRVILFPLTCSTTVQGPHQLLCQPLS